MSISYTYIYIYIYMASFKHVSRTGKRDSKKVGERVSKNKLFQMEVALRVIQSTHRHLSHMETLKASKGTTLNSKSHQKQGAKAREIPENQRSWSHRTPGRQGRPWAVQPGRLPGGGHGNRTLKEQGHIWANPKQRGGAIA